MCTARTDQSICSQIAGAAGRREGTFLASVLSVSVLGSIALAQVFPCLVQLSLVMLVLCKDCMWNVQKNQGSILSPTQAVSWSRTARANVKKTTGPSTRPSARWRPKTFTFLAAIERFPSQYSQTQDNRRFSYFQVATKIRAGGKHLLAGDPSAQVLKTFFCIFWQQFCSFREECRMPLVLH